MLFGHVLDTAGSHALQAQLQKEEEEAARRKLELEATREDRILIYVD